MSLGDSGIARVVAFRQKSCDADSPWMTFVVTYWR